MRPSVCNGSTVQWERMGPARGNQRWVSGFACGTVGEWNNCAGWRHNILKTHVIGQLECTPEYELFTTAMAKVLFHLFLDFCF